MKNTIIILIVIIALLAAGGFTLYKYLGGYPVGFQNGRLIILQYFCSDVCPQYGSWHKEYFGINTEADCEKIGGRPLIDSAWGGFIGCSPDNVFIGPKKAQTKLESVLYQLIMADNPDEFGRQNGLDIQDGKVRVVIKLADPEYSLPINLGMEETQSGDMLQAKVFVVKLLELAGDSAVKMIRPPFKAVPLQ